MAETHDKAKIDYLAGMKYQEIADKYGVSLSTVKSWKTRYSWNRKSMRTKSKKVCVQIDAAVRRRGAPNGNKNAVGAGPPIGNKNATTHNIYSTIIREELGEEEAELFDAMASVNGLEHELQIARYKLARLLREQKLRDMQGVMGGPDGADSYRLKDDFYENAILKAADVVRKIEAQLHKESVDLERLELERRKVEAIERKAGDGDDEGADDDSFLNALGEKAAEVWPNGV